jgi:hypothetical protein
VHLVSERVENSKPLVSEPPIATAQQYEARACLVAIDTHLLARIDSDNVLRLLRLL